MTAILTENLTRTYQMGDTEVRALAGIDLTVETGEFVAIMGASGSGKSTLMNILGALDTPTGGEYWLDGVLVSGLSRDQLADVRSQRLGFVFQQFNLLARTSALENVELPLLYDRTARVPDPRAAARRALDRVDLGDRLDHEPAQLSGGQQQRVAIARALVNEPAMILADEPTGNLDSRTSLEVMALFQELNASGITIVLVTHEAEISAYAGRVVELRDGAVLRDEPVTEPRSARLDRSPTTTLSAGPPLAAAVATPVTAA